MRTKNCYYYIGTKEVNNLEMSSVSTISHEERLLPQCFSANVIIKNVYNMSVTIRIGNEREHIPEIH